MGLPQARWQRTMTGWEDRLLHVLRSEARDGRAITTGRLPHQWRTSRGELRCVVCGTKGQPQVPGMPPYVTACPQSCAPAVGEVEGRAGPLRCARRAAGMHGARGGHGGRRWRSARLICLRGSVDLRRA